MAAVAVPRDGAPDDSGHAHLVLANQALQEFTGDVTATNDEETEPGDAPTHGANDTSGTIANTNSDYQTARERYYTQLGAKDGIRDVIIATTDPALLCELKHKIWEYKKHTPLELIDHIENQITKHDVSAITSLMARRDASPTMDGDDSLRVQYKELEEIIATLKDDHGTGTVHQGLIAIHWLVYVRVKDTAFREAVLAWGKLSESSQTWKKFKELFADADDDRRAREKVAAEYDTEKAAGRANINNAAERQELFQGATSSGRPSSGAVTEDRLALILGETLQAWDEEQLDRTTEQINAILDAREKKSAPANPIKDSTSTSTTLSTDALLREIRDLKSEIAGLKKKSKGGGGGSGGGGGGGNGDNRWWLTKTADSVTREGKKYWWCPHHNDGKGSYCRHKPSEHDEWAKAKKEKRKFHSAD